MIIKTESILIRTEDVVYISTIKERYDKTYWDIDDKKYVTKTTYAFRVGFASGDRILIEDNDFNKLNNIRRKIENNMQ